MYPWGPKSLGGRGLAHPHLVDMTGRHIDDWTVVRRMPNVNGNARWLCRHACGGDAVIDGIRLRSKPPQFCDNCLPKRRGRVTRLPQGPHVCGCTPTEPCPKARVLFRERQTVALRNHLERTIR